MIASMSPMVTLEFKNITLEGPNIPGFDAVLAADGRSNGLTITGFDRALVIPPNGHHQANDLRVDHNRTGVDNGGTFDGPDTKIE